MHVIFWVLILFMPGVTVPRYPPPKVVVGEKSKSLLISKEN